MIYVAQAGGKDGPVKIGRAKNPRLRVAGMRTGCPTDLRLLTFAEWHDTNEMLIHWYLRDSRTRGEWFAPTKRVEAVCHRIDKNEFHELMGEISADPEFDRNYFVGRTSCWWPEKPHAQ